jgi:hypothetical protein
VLKEFSEALGMMINQSKSQHFFFNTPPIVKSHIADTLYFHPILLPSNYLGVPLFMSSLKKSPSKDLLIGLAKKLENWAFRSLNLAGRLTLIKFLKAMPLYRSSVLSSPKYILKEIQNIQRNFF